MPCPTFPGLGAEDAAVPDSLPPGQVYDWYRSARELHDDGDADGAVTVLLWAVAAEPNARSLREALARAEFDAHRYVDSAASFQLIVDEDPADHYAQFGLGLASLRAGALDAARTISRSPSRCALTWRTTRRHCVPREPRSSGETTRSREVRTREP